MNNIASFRKKISLTQGELAAQCGWSYQSRIAQYESGERTPSIQDCKKIIQALTSYGLVVTLDDLFPETNAA